jgi:hypothetical protein
MRYPIVSIIAITIPTIFGLILKRRRRRKQIIKRLVWLSAAAIECCLLGFMTPVTIMLVPGWATVLSA